MLDESLPDFLRYRQVPSTANITNYYPVKRSQLLFGGTSFLLLCFFSVKPFWGVYNVRSQVFWMNGKRHITTSWSPILREVVSVLCSYRIWNIPGWALILLGEYTSLIFIWTNSDFFKKNSNIRCNWNT